MAVLRCHMKLILEFAYLSAVLKGLRKLNMYELSCPTTDVGVCSGMIPAIQMRHVNLRFK